jgi:REP element-mobilizing transposase RayT
MANTYSEIHLQFVFAVQNRISLIKAVWENNLYKYITGIVHNNSHKMICINGMPDHVHMVVGMRPTQSISDLLQESSKWVNDNRLCAAKFGWQDGYAAFSYSKSDLPRVIGYVNNQKAHHRKTSFLEEYKTMLEELGVTYNEKYLPVQIL